MALGGFSAGEMSFLLLIAMRPFLKQIFMNLEYSSDFDSMLGNVRLSKRLANVNVPGSTELYGLSRLICLECYLLPLETKRQLHYG